MAYLGKLFIRQLGSGAPLIVANDLFKLAVAEGIAVAILGFSYAVGVKQEAVAWFGAAVRTEPTIWIYARNFASQLPDWKQEDRDTLAEVLGAWQANPPTWP